MDFFEHQAKANSTSSFLVISYLLALAVIAIGFNLVGFIIWLMASQPFNDLPAHQQTASHLLQLWFESRYFWQVSLCVVLFIGGISLVNWLTLRQGGQQVAKMMGGRVIPSDTRNKDEKQLFNVVEEMALASGVPTPALYVMDTEHSLNAFAAGYSPNEAAICVTRGLMISLDRDELQGVIGHEFSHILNGDMRINIRIISILYGLVATGQLGLWLIRLAFRSGGDSKGGIIFLLVPGILIWLVGSLGVLCSRCIKAAISRQREFLADASAVQFTRQTQGIAAALYKIGHHRTGSQLNNRHAEDLSHMCIAKSINVRFESLLATHPPIDERISRLDPQFLTKEKIKRAQTKVEARQSSKASSSHASGASAYTQSNISDTPNTSSMTSSFDSNSPNQEANTNTPSGDIQAEEMVEFVSPYQDVHINSAIQSIGLTDQSSIEMAQQYLRQLPEEILAALHQPQYAALISLLLIAQANSETSESIQYLRDSLHATQASLIDFYLPKLEGLNELPIYPLMQIGINAIKQLPAKEKETLLTQAKELIVSDQQVHPKELFLYFVLFRHLNNRAGRRVKTSFHSMNKVAKDITILLHYLVQFTTPNLQEQALTQAFATLNLQQPTSIKKESTKKESKSHNALANSIFRIEHLAPLLKRNVLVALADMIQHDSKVTKEELDWIRMLADCWDCPIPISIQKTMI